MISMPFPGLASLRAARLLPRPAGIACCALAAALLLNGCAIPRAGPTAQNIVEQRKSETQLNYALVDVGKNVMAFAATRPRESLVRQFGAGPRSSDLRIAVGDVVTVNVWEAPPGTLFGTNMSVAGFQQSTGSTVAIPPQTVTGNGTIGVPYAGRIKVLGNTPSQVEQQIVKSLEGKAVQPQALVTIQRSTANSVTVTGEVAAGARISLTGAGERVLDAIASAGGIRAPASDSIVGLTRNGVAGRIPFDLMLEHPEENIRIRPGDLITVVREPRTFLVFGAAGRNAELPFDASRITMADALGKAAGLNDQRADVTGVFLMRHELASVARRFVPQDNPLLASGELIPVIYRFNMRDANTWLAMQRFEIQPRDVIYIANASGADIQKVMAIFQGVSAPAMSATSIGISAGALQ
ncbi:polysaccharide export protein [Phyllobacterium sp. 21LDTY02-6]|uniref:polysaccharide biosynthesis/export family protein n=1 Tax=Phyllobacterium sp. 21LDTY02-6 TaxID=2944903 RepID=UPI002020E045|nr:polysaccharide biosynthesis/export family protein [Phyllobacterium sp. 21LDTY02-6]MCO4318303.1 polysaccharide export protein [Phyllobacterium sp. 21LDTY02-6]